MVDFNKSVWKVIGELSDGRKYTNIFNADNEVEAMKCGKNDGMVKVKEAFEVDNLGDRIIKGIGGLEDS